MTGEGGLAKEAVDEVLMEKLENPRSSTYVEDMERRRKKEAHFAEVCKFGLDLGYPSNFHE